MNILAIDIGTSSARGILYDGEGRSQFIHPVTYSVYFPGENLVEQDPGDFDSAVAEICAAGAAWAKDRGQTVDALSLTAQRSSIIPVNKQGEPLVPPSCGRTSGTRGSQPPWGPEKRRSTP